MINPHDVLRHYVTGAIERGEKTPIVEQPANQPNTEQLAALVAYAKAHGRTWKSDLLDDWMHARQPGLLQQVRNQFGPSWLATFKLPD